MLGGDDAIEVAEAAAAGRLASSTHQQLGGTSSSQTPSLAGFLAADGAKGGVAKPIKDKGKGR